MTDRQTQTLRNAYLQRAKVKVLMAAKPDNAIVQAFGGLVFGCYNRAIARFEAKHGPLH
jgi:hypothetical protein